MGHFVIVISYTQDRSIEVRETSFGVLIRIPYVPARRSFFKYTLWVDHLRFGRQLIPYIQRCIESYQPDIVEIPSPGGYGVFLTRAKWLHKPVITRFHGSLGKIPIDPEVKQLFILEQRRMGVNQTKNKIAVQWNLPQWLLERDQITHSAFVTLPSIFSGFWLNRQLNLTPTNQVVIQNGVNFDELSRLRTANKSTNSTNYPSKKIVFVGRCSISKGIGVLLRAIPRILAEEPHAIVQIIGLQSDANIAKMLELSASKYHGRVVLFGRLPREELLPILANSSVMVHPSFYEVSSMAILEAMALGIPVVATDTRPLTEIVIDKETGLLFKPGDGDSLAEAVLTILSADNANRRRMQAASVERIRNNFDITNISKKLMDFYMDALKSHSGNA